MNDACGIVLDSSLLRVLKDQKNRSELKSVQALNNTMKAQLLNYLRLSKMKLGFLVNFRNKSLEWKRLILTE